MWNTCFPVKEGLKKNLIPNKTGKQVMRIQWKDLNTANSENQSNKIQNKNISNSAI